MQPVNNLISTSLPISPSTTLNSNEVSIGQNKRKIGEVIKNTELNAKKQKLDTDLKIKFDELRLKLIELSPNIDKSCSLEQIIEGLCKHEFEKLEEIAKLFSYLARLAKYKQIKSSPNLSLLMSHNLEKCMKTATFPSFGKDKANARLIMESLGELEKRGFLTELSPAGQKERISLIHLALLLDDAQCIEWYEFIDLSDCLIAEFLRSYILYFPSTEPDSERTLYFLKDVQLLGRTFPLTFLPVQAKTRLLQMLLPGCPHADIAENLPIYADMIKYLSLPVPLNFCERLSQLPPEKHREAYFEGLARLAGLYHENKAFRASLLTAIALMQNWAESKDFKKIQAFEVGGISIIFQSYR